MSSSPVPSNQMSGNQKPVSKTLTNQNFKFGLASPVARQQQLLYSEYLSDVIFRVGNAGELIHAHKMILTVASEVFYVQFNGNFVESKQDNCTNPVVIEDIEPAIFREVLRYIYCEDVFLTADNVMDIYYASQKYLLTGLNGVCENFLKTSINEENVLKVFNGNRQYGHTKVDELCMKIIQDNPLKCFETKDFLALCEEAVKLIVATDSMNCQTEQLRDAIDKWCEANKSEVQFKPKIEGMLCRKLHSFSAFGYGSSINTHMELNVHQNIYLYGIGVFIGKRASALHSQENVNITVIIEPYNVTVTKNVGVGRDLFVQDIMFQKVTVSRQCQVMVTVTDGIFPQGNDYFCQNDFVPVDSLGKVGLTVAVHSTDLQYNRIQNQNYYSTPNPVKKINCVAYLLFNVAE